jgi:parvulin-like peptidyl-prolyl isomerase
VLYREALKLGMDQDDEVIRRRMVQKLEFLTEDLAAQAQPTQAELQAFFDENLDDYRLPELRSFTHIFYNIDRRGESAFEDAERDLAALRASPTPVARAPERGDRFLLQYDYPAQSPDEVRRAFGQRFAEALFEFEPGDWQGPIASGYGLHLVRVIDVQEAHVPELAEVRNIVERDFASELRQRANDAVLAGLLENYDVTVDEETIRARSLQIDSSGGGR